MKLIIQIIDGVPYAYREKNRHFKVVEPLRGTTRLDGRLLDEECELSAYDNSHFVFDLE